MSMELNFHSVQGVLRVPPSKSYTQRALVAAMLHEGITEIHYPGNSEDECAVAAIVRQQTNFSSLEHGWRIESNGAQQFKGEFNCGESGLAARLLTPVAALSSEEVLLTGSGSLLQRPMDLFEGVLPALGVHLQYSSPEKRLPLHIRGPLQPRDILVDGGLSSQFISGLLFAFAYSATQSATIQVNNPVSIPYLDMTCSVLEKFGKTIGRAENHVFIVDPLSKAAEKSIFIEIESDWSSAAFWICAAAINGKMLLQGLSTHSLQADRHILHVLTQCGAHWHFSEKGLELESKERLAFEIDLTHCPDLFPVLAIFAAACKGTSRLTGVHRLKHKESDRAEAILSLLQQISIEANVVENTLIIEGGMPDIPAKLAVPADHRMVMAAALSSMFASQPVQISNAEAVSKSYPDFFTDLRQLGK
jgi:3-phosphoshikimate 1-carboxyvinyltransferase